MSVIGGGTSSGDDGGDGGGGVVKKASPNLTLYELRKKISFNDLYEIIFKSIN